MTGLSPREHYHAVLDGKPGVRTLYWELGYWAETIERFYREGLKRSIYAPAMGMAGGSNVFAEFIPWPPRMGSMAYRDLDVSRELGFDPGAYRIGLNCRHAPTFRTEVLEEDETTQVIINPDGVKCRASKRADSIPHFLQWPVHDRASWEKVKEERFNLNQLHLRFPDRWKDNVPTLKNRDYPLGTINDGFFSLPRELMGVENQLMMYIMDPKLMHDINEHICKVWIAMYEELLAQIDLDFFYFWEDMSFKNGPMISPKFFQEFCTPYYRRMIDFLKGKGIRHLFVDTDGNCWKLIPLFIEVGITGMYPFEVQSGMDIVEVRKSFPEFVIVGGLNKIKVSEGKAATDAELDAKLPYMLRQGRFIPTCDHLVHPDISWKDFCYYREKIRQAVEKNQG